MIDAAIWLLRWTLAGAALCAVIIAAVYVLERMRGQVSLNAIRAALMALLAAPMVALAPPLFTYSGSDILLAKPDRFAPRYMEKHNAQTIDAATTIVQGAAPRALIRNRSAGALAGALMALWIGGVAICAISRQRSLSRLSRAFRDGEAFPTSFAECLLSADAPTPLLFGVLRPRMLAPADFRDWPVAEREAVLCHEAAHAKRGDLIWAFLGDVVRTLYWHAPPVRFLVSQHMLATEEACDFTSYAHRGDRHDYARTLIAVARRVGGHASPGLAMTASSLSRRIERLASPATNNGAISGFVVLAAGAAAASMLALSAPAVAASGSIRAYIFNPADGKCDIYAFSDGQRATGAIVEKCTASLMPNAADFVDDMEARIERDDEDELSVVWVVGPGSKTELGPCSEKDESARDEDSLVLITDASEKQARDLIRQIHGLSPANRQQMAAQLGIDL